MISTSWLCFYHWDLNLGKSVYPRTEWACLWYEPQYIAWCLHTHGSLQLVIPLARAERFCQDLTSFEKICGWVKRRDTNCCHTQCEFCSQQLAANPSSLWLTWHWGDCGTQGGAVATYLGDTMREIQGSCSRGKQDVRSKSTFARGNCLSGACDHGKMILENSKVFETK